MLKQAYTLSNGIVIPSIGLGTWELQGNTCTEVVTQALKIGYRHIDTALIYGNHKEVAQGIRNSGLKRDEIFLTSKLWRDSMEADQVKIALQTSLDELETDYLDLYLIHWPNIQEVDPRATLTAMQELQTQGLIRSIGVSNFTIKHLKYLEDIPIQVNQVEFHPTLNQVDLYTYCRLKGILITAYSPLGRSHDLNLPEIQSIADKYNRKPSQIILNWILSKNMVVIPKTTNLVHLAENLESLNFTLDSTELRILDNLNEDERTVNPSFSEFNV